MKIQVKKLTSFKDKSIGLLNTDKAHPIYFKTRFGIHTLGMKFPIDVLILNSEYEVVNLKENLKPNRIFVWNPKFYNVIELPAGEIHKHKLNLKQRITINIK